MTVAEPVLVIGGGIGGLATGLALDRDDIDVQVFERAPRLQEVGAGIGLWPNAIRALDRLAVGEAIRKLAVPGTSASARTADGTVLVRTSETLLHHHFGAPTTGIMRAELQMALVEAFGADRISLGREFTHYEEDARGVTAHFADGTSARGRALIGADGLRSAVRGQLLADGPPRYRGDTAWRGLAPVPDDLRPLTEVFETLGCGRRMGLFPLADDRVLWFASANRPEGEQDGPDVLDELRRLFAGWHHPIPRILEVAEPDRIVRTDIYDRPVAHTWITPRIALLGDAAHPMGPDLGQGACLAIEDADVLGRALATTSDTATALTRYQRIRRPRVVKVARFVALTGWMARLTNPTACRLRDGVLGLTPPLAVRAQLTALAGWDPPAVRDGRR